MRKLFKFIMLNGLTILLFGCQTQLQEEKFNPEKAALARLKLGLEYLSQANESNEYIKAAHYNLSLANQYSPNNPNIMLGLALFDQQVGEYQEAEIIYKRIVEMEPYNSMYLIHYGSFLCATKRYLEALDKFDSAIATDQKRWKSDALEQKGYCAIQNSDITNADKAFKQLFLFDSTKRKQVASTAEFYRQKNDTRVANYLSTTSSQ